jgi:hypothetical protein
MINKLLEALFGPDSSHLSVDDRPRQRQLKNLFDFNSLSNLLHYSFYDEDNAIYHNKDSYGFILEAELLVGSNDALEKDLGTLFKDILPAGSNMQFLLLASNKTNSLISSWERSYQRASFPILKDMAAAKAAYENSAWLCMLKQKADTIERMSESGQFGADGYMKKLYKSLRSKSGEYSEIAIIHDNVKFVGRLILAPFSKVLYSTKPAEYMQVQDLVKQGYSMQEAISKTAEQLYGEEEVR